MHHHLISEAKNLPIGADLTVAQIAYRLGFEIHHASPDFSKRKPDSVPLLSVSTAKIQSI